VKDRADALVMAFAIDRQLTSARVSVPRRCLPSTDEMIAAREWA